MGSGCGAVGRAVASDTRGPGFESSHRQLLLNIYLLLTVCRKDENKEKEARNGPFLKKITLVNIRAVLFQKCFISVKMIQKKIKFHFTISLAEIL